MSSVKRSFNSSRQERMAASDISRQSSTMAMGKSECSSSRVDRFTMGMLRSNNASQVRWQSSPLPLGDMTKA